MSVSLKPSASLGFNRPLTQLVKRVLTVTNHNNEPVAFKVKTTAPKQYCVRPNSGRIEPGESVDVQVLLQAMKDEPPLSAKCKDKFLIQSTIITHEKESMPLSDLWNSADTESKIVQQKIKVVFLPPLGQQVPEEDEQPSSILNDSMQFKSAYPMPGTNGHPDVGLPQEPQGPLERAFSPDYAEPEEPIPMEIPAPPPKPITVAEPIHIAPKPAPPVVPQLSSHDEELRTQLSAAQAEINRLRALLESVPEPAADEGMRRRRMMADRDNVTVVSDRSETDVGTAVDSLSASSEGVPPQVVVGIALAVFVLTYVFF